MIHSMSGYEEIQVELKELVRLVRLDEQLSAIMAHKSVGEKRKYSSDTTVVVADKDEIIKDFQEINHLFDLEFKYRILTADHVLRVDSKSALCHVQRLNRVEMLLIKHGIINQRI